MGNRKGLILGLLATVVLGFTFLGFQMYEYVHAYAELNLKLTTGVFGFDLLHAHGLPRLRRDARARSC